MLMAQVPKKYSRLFILERNGDIAYWKGIAQDAIVMNLDDLLCTGITDNILFSSTIDRNKRLIPGEVLTIDDGIPQRF